jgi:hypothetical protein
MVIVQSIVHPAALKVAATEQYLFKESAMAFSALSFSTEPVK